MKTKIKQCLEITGAQNKIAPCALTLKTLIIKFYSTRLSYYCQLNWSKRTFFCIYNLSKESERAFTAQHCTFTVTMSKPDIGLKNEWFTILRQSLCLKVGYMQKIIDKIIPHFTPWNWDFGIKRKVILFC